MTNKYARIGPFIQGSDGRFRSHVAATRRFMRGVPLVVAAILTLSACGGSDEPDAIPTASSSPGTETTTPTPSPTETVSAEQAAAEQALDRFLQVESQLYANPKAQIGALDSVSYGLARRTAEEFVQGYRDRGFVITGSTSTIAREMTKSRLGDEPPTLVFDECRDTSRVAITQNGAPAQGVTTTDREKTTYGVSYWENRWQVSFIRPSGQNAC